MLLIAVSCMFVFLLLLLLMLLPTCCSNGLGAKMIANDSNDCMDDGDRPGRFLQCQLMQLQPMQPTSRLLPGD